MNLTVLDLPRLIEVNKMEEVTSPRLFSTKITFDPDGILSNEIFGVSKTDRRSTFSYMSLNRKFLHPHVYGEMMKKKSMFRNVPFLLAGQKRYVVKNGLLTESPEDPNSWTGLTAFYEHWDEIDWGKSTSSNKTGKSILSKLPKNLIFVDKFIIIPPAYRDVMLSGTMDSSDHVNELNDIYQRLMRMNALLSEGGLFARTQYATQLKVEEVIMEAYDYFKRMISHKNGLIRKNLLGKSVDYGVRAVISAPTYNNETINDMIVDFEHTAVPISMCCSTFYPFIESWLMQFFQREVLNSQNYFSFVDSHTNTPITATIKDPEIQFSDKAVRKLMNDYALNPDNRFKLLELEVEAPNPDGKGKLTKKVHIKMKGKMYSKSNVEETLDRFMTITDLLYIACVDVCEKRHVMISRYPVGTDKGIILTKVRVRSTIDHIKVIYNDKEYPFYPKIDLNTPHHKIGVQFLDTITYACAHLEGMGEYI